MRKTATTVGLGVVALVAGGLTASQASADTTATAYADDGAHAVHYTAGDTSSVVRITEEGNDGTRFVIDDIVPIAVGEGCVHPDAADTTRVVCTLTEFGDFWTRVIADLGAGNDELWLRAGNENSVHGGAGHDNINVSPNTAVWGDDGNDYLVGGWLVYGGAGDDIVSGIDRPGAVYGDDGDDVITGSSGSDELRGGPGDDTIEAGLGHDVVYGNSGEDLLRGGKGHDELSGGPDDDVVYGNSGDDVLRGGGGTDQLSGGPGTDTVTQD